MRSHFLISLRIALAASLLYLLTASAAAQMQPSVDHFFTQKHFGQVRLSPSGQYVMLMDYRNSAQKQIMITQVNAEAAPQVIALDNTDIVWAKWINNDQVLLAKTTSKRLKLMDGFGDSGAAQGGRFVKMKTQNSLSIINRDGTNEINLFSGDVDIDQQSWSPNDISTLSADPEHIAIETLSDDKLHVYKVNINTGQAKRLHKGDAKTRSYFLDATGEIIAKANRNEKNGDISFRTRRSTFLKVPYEDIGKYGLAGIGLDNSAYVFKTPDNAPTTAIFQSPMKARAQERKVASDPRADFGFSVDDRNGYYIGAAFAPDLIKYTFVDPAHQKRMDGLVKYFGDQTNVYLTHNSEGHNIWSLYVNGPKEPGAYYIYDSAAKSIEHLVDSYDGTDPKAYARTTIYDYATRDGVTISSYVTHPLGKSDTTKAPLIMLPHGGPHARDHYGFDGVALYLASRGYRVVQPNFRGSTGFGQSFELSGYQQWGRAMQNDLTDGVNAMIKDGLTDADKVCIMGISYGGYAALWATIDTPELYQCAVSINGVADIEDQANFFIDKYQRYIGAEESIHNRIGNPATQSEELRAYSPTHNTDKISTPILLIHGNFDDTVPIRQARAFRDAAKDKSFDLTYIEKAESGHSLRQDLGEYSTDGSQIDHGKPIKSTLGDVEAFLAKHLK